MYTLSKIRKRRKAISAINVTPFVDVMLVLLVIFMVTSPMLVAGINVNLPHSTGKVIDEQIEPVSITVDRAGAVYINNTPIPQDSLLKKLVAVTHANKDTKIFVRGDKEIGYGKIVSIIGLISEAGFTKIALVTDLNRSHG
jgi:biopolymer transport protein TolR